MRLPRWTVWPAMLVLAAFLVPALPFKRSGSSSTRGARTPANAPAHPRLVMLGIDGLDPRILRETVAQFPELTPNWRALIDKGGLHDLATTTPPQSPVAWSSFITGRDPGGHGIFDFIHRDPMTRAPVSSTTKGEETSGIGLWDGWRIPVGGSSESNRSGKAFWTILAEHGVPADVWRMPANFPVEASDGWSFSGMMTPALDSAYGESKIYTSSIATQTNVTSERVVPVRAYDGVIDTALSGPENPLKDTHERITAPMRIYVDAAAEKNGVVLGAAVIEVGEQPLVLSPGQWSDFTRVRFESVPIANGMVATVWGEVRFYLRSLEPDFELYCSAVNVDPVEPLAPVSEPTSASATVARESGLYYTQGMPEDVMALKDHALTDVEFMSQADVVHVEGLRLLDYALDRYLKNEKGGLLFFYFSGVDLCSHMMWRHSDAAHPSHDAEFAATDSSKWSGRARSTWKDVIADLYLRMDPVIGRVRAALPADATLIVMSDHGFAPYHRKFSLNTWLYENGYLVLKDGETKEKPRGEGYHEVYMYAPKRGVEGVVDWTKTRAYGMGFNGLYLNLKGREQNDTATKADEAGIVEPGPQAEALLREIASKLEALVDPKNGQRVVLRADLARTVYHGKERIDDAPDLIVGFNSGYDNSDPSSLGRIPHDVLSDNLSGSFNGSHLMAPEVVPGVLLTNGAVRDGQHGLQDLTIEILHRYGIEPSAGMSGHPVLR